MTTYLLFADSAHSPAMRHEIGEPVVGRVAFIEHDGKRIVVGDESDRSTFARREDVVDEFWTGHEFGWEELFYKEGFPTHLVGPEVLLRALQRAGANEVVVPQTFPVLTADFLREKGIDLSVDEEAWSTRRRHKTPGELEGIERAQRAAETAMLTAARMLRDAEPTASGELRFEGEILTAELIREAMLPQLQAQGAESQMILVHSGDACLRGHDAGTGPIMPNTSCIIDVWPRDMRTGVFTDMTRTFVPGTPSEELAKMHDHCSVALEIALEHLKPGRSDAYRKVAEYFRAQGFATKETHEGPEPPQEGFPHELGHGVGLEVHERPYMGPRSDELLEGDVVAVEPGLYLEGVGGVRLEDTVFITSSGAERFTDPFPYDLQH